MLLNVRRVLGSTVVGWVVTATSSGAAQAAEVPVPVPGVNVTTGAMSTRLGGEFRAELLFDDHGIEKHSGYKPDRTSKLQVSNANLLLGGNINADTEYSFRFNLLNPTTTPLDYGYGTHWFTKVFGFSIGKERVLQGGWDHMDQGYRTHAEGFYAQNLALADYDTMLALHVKAAGLLSLQIVNDVKQDATSSNNEVKYRWNKDAHPTFVLGWLGEFGPIQPLIDFGSYDNNKSHWVDVGIKTQMNGLHATLDFHNDNVNYRVPVAGQPDAKENDVKNSYTVNVSYEVKGVITPWAYYSYYDNKEAADSKANLSDVKYNTVTPDANQRSGNTYAWNDNGTVWGVGLDFNTFGRNWNPFVAFVSESGKFMKLDGTTNTATRTENIVKIGVLGQI